MIKYPTRCRILDADGEPMGPGLTCKNPEASIPHLGKCGTAELLDEWTVKIHLDDGSVLMGWDCWWAPIDEAAEAAGGDDAE